MFYSFSSKEFANLLKKIRLSLRLSQSDVASSVGVSVDGLRKIENGHVTPKFETLVNLSIIYKRNLIKLMSQYSIVYDLDSLYNQAQNFIDVADTQNLINLKIDVLSIKSDIVNNGLIEITEYEQLLYFIDSSVQFLINTPDSLDECISYIFHSLKLTIASFKINNFENYSYNDFELRHLHLFALAKRRMGDFSFSIKILEFMINNCNFCNTSDMSMKNINKLYFSLSYTYHEVQNYESSLFYSDKGIEYSVKNKRFDELHLLYYRKGIAEYFLNYPNYINSLNKSITLLEAIQSPLVDTYRDITLKNYGILI